MAEKMTGRHKLDVWEQVLHSKALGLCLSFGALIVCASTGGTSFAQGVVSADLGSPVTHRPISEADWSDAVSFKQFFRTNWGTTPPVATTAWLAWDQDNMYVRMLCSDPHPVERAGAALRRTDTAEIFLHLTDAPPQDVWKFSVSLDNEKKSEFAGKANGTFEGQTVSAADQWTATFAIPWSTLGGRPEKSFGLQIARERHTSDQVLSPSALDYHDGPAAEDEFIETTLGGQRKVQTAEAGLVTLPSGRRRWVFPATLVHAPVAERKAIWALQQQLPQPTTDEIFAYRLRMAGQWYHLLVDESIGFNAQSGEFIVDKSKDQMEPWTARAAINESLRKGDTAAAYRVLDTLLAHFDQVSRGWFADGSPGSIRDDQWIPLSTVSDVSIGSHEVRLRGLAGKQAVALSISMPSIGGVRIRGAERGHFDSESLPLLVKRNAGTMTVSAGDSQVEVQLKPSWRISVSSRRNPANAWSLQQGSISYRFAPDGKILDVDLRGELADGEDFRGFGERFDSFRRRGRTITLWQQDASDPAAGAPRFETYKAVPLWYSTRGYSVFWNSSYRMRADIGDDDPQRYRITVNGPVLDLYVWPVAPQAALESYTALTGKPLLAPRWTFEPWAGGGGGRWGRNAVQVQIDTMKKFHELDIPHSALYAEGIGSSDPRLVNAMEPQGIRVFTWHRSQSRNMETTLPGLPENQLPKMRFANGTPVGYPAGHPLSGHFPYVDFTNPRALDQQRAEWKSFLDVGDSGSMIDFGDLVPPDAKFYDGSTGDAMHNFYAYGYHKTVATVFHERRGDDFILFARSGAPGDQASVACFAGDHNATYEGLTAVITGGISAGAAGFSNWGSDMGGYFGKADEEVYLRWVQFAAFSPIMRAHGETPREPWFYSDPAVDVYRRYAWLRENLLDYMDGAAIDTHQSGLPILQGLAIAYPNNQAAVSDDEYMFGSDLLVAPVHEEGDRRTMVVPAGQWTSIWDGSVIGPGQQTVDAPIDRIPVYLRSGVVLPLVLATSLKLGDSLTSGRVRAVLVTPPETTVTSHLSSRDSGTSEYVNEPTPNGFRVKLSNVSSTRYVVVTGLKSEPVKVFIDGSESSQLTEDQREFAPLSYVQGQRPATTVQLPPVRGVNAGGQRPVAPPPAYGWYETPDHHFVVRLPQNVNQTIEFVMH